MLLITDNKNVESRSLSVVKYFINNIMSTELTASKGLGLVIMLLITENKNVESRTRSVVKYVINNIMSTELTGRR